MLRLSDFVMDRKRFHNVRRGLCNSGLENSGKLKFCMKNYVFLNKPSLVYITSCNARHQSQYQYSIVKLKYKLTKFINLCYFLNLIIKYDSLLKNNIIPENIIQYLQFKLIIYILD